jgi:hypothetical protein
MQICIHILYYMISVTSVKTWGWMMSQIFFDLALLLFDFLRCKVSLEHNYCVIAEQSVCGFCIHIINKNSSIQNASWTIPFGRLKGHLHSSRQLYVGPVLTVLPEKHQTHSLLQERFDIYNVKLRKFTYMKFRIMIIMLPHTAKQQRKWNM